jgi:hypothetical protein
MAATYKPVKQNDLRSSAPWALRPAQVPTRSEVLAVLGRQLRSNYKPIVQGPIPDGLRELVERLATTKGCGGDGLKV